MSWTRLSDEVASEHYEEAKQFIVTLKVVKVTDLQRKFRIGYVAAAKIMERLEDECIVGRYVHGEGRKVLRNI
ncbi:DNA translocase FtsK [Bacillus paranthracis]|uniref:DNA translocase FtsK n=1 Tax=Bacillus paranthracis TaxID=2026186 RepID=UPI001E42D864|nr:DNA translocase FtsK [Bacillus paranthracis]MCD1182174.1 cell division protein FtsK [Bacillus paranthracis]HDR4569041.1 cell division protein FtsK [Bacillus paranthracis]